MNDDQLLDYVSHYQDARPKGGKGWLFWTSLTIHAGVLTTAILVPLYRVGADLPRFETMSAFMVTTPASPPPPPPPPPASPPPSSASSSGHAPRLAPITDFVAPIAIPTAIPAEDFGPIDLEMPGGVEGGVPGGVVGGIVGGLEEAPPPPSAKQEPVRVDFRQQEARPIQRVDPAYPDLAAQAHVQGIVIVEVLVDERGVPAGTKILRSVPLLDAAAINAVEQWRWNPYTSGGRAVPFLVTVTVDFQLTTS